MLPGARVASLLGAPFPVTVVQGLREFSEGEQVVGLPNLGDPVLETIRKTVVELEPERTSTPGNLRSQPVELSDVLGDPLVVGHPEVH